VIDFLRSGVCAKGRMRVLVGRGWAAMGLSSTVCARRDTERGRHSNFKLYLRAPRETERDKKKRKGRVGNGANRTLPPASGWCMRPRDPQIFVWSLNPRFTTRLALCLARHSDTIQLDCPKEA
jgi:hypothetical protein